MTVDVRQAEDYKDGAWLVTMHDEYDRIVRGRLFRGPAAEQRARAYAHQLEGATNG